MYVGECIPFLKNSDLEWNMKTMMEINLEKINKMLSQAQKVD